MTGDELNLHLDKMLEAIVESKQLLASCTDTFKWRMSMHMRMERLRKLADELPLKD